MLEDMGERLPASAAGRTVLDVGVGTGAALLENKVAVLGASSGKWVRL